MIRRSILLALVACLGLWGCATTSTAPSPAPEPEVAPAPPPPADYSALYEDLEAVQEQFREGLDLLLAGQSSEGRNAMEEAGQRLAAGLVECAEAPGCEVERFRVAVDRLVGLQGAFLEDQINRVAGLEAAVAEADAKVEEEPGTATFADDLGEIERTQSLLNGTDLREIIELNGPVRAAIDDWLTWMRPNLMEAYENYQFLRPRMKPVWDEAGLPEALLFAMIATESGGKVHSYSRAGAAGPLQFMRYTGRLYGLETVDGFDQRLDPEKAARAAVGYLNDRFHELNDSLEKSLAAYNGGEGRMRNLHRHNRDKSFWDGRIYYYLPRETREYVPRILGAAWLYLHAEDYNLEFPQRDSSTGELQVAEEISLSELAVCLGQVDEQRNGWFRTLRNLNPELDPGERVEKGLTLKVPTAVLAAYEENCLDGDLLARVRELHEANYPPEPEMDFYVVRAGDTLGRISSRYGCASVREIGAINNLRPPSYMIRVGQRLKVPRC